MKTTTQKMIAAAAASVVVLVCISIASVQTNRFHEWMNTVDLRCTMYLNAAEDNFSAYLKDGDPVQYQWGTGNLYAFLACYELSERYLAEHYISVRTAHGVLLGTPEGMETDRMEQLVTALTILEEDMDALPGYTALDVFSNWELYQ